MFEQLKAYYHHTASSSVLLHGDYVYVCTGNGRSWVPGRIPFSPLTPSLVVFNKMTGQLVARDDEQIGEQMFGQSFDALDRTIDSHVKNLRRKIEPDPSNPHYILTVHGVGYKLELK